MNIETYAKFYNLKFPLELLQRMLHANSRRSIFYGALFYFGLIVYFWLWNHHVENFTVFPYPFGTEFITK